MEKAPAATLNINLPQTPAPVETAPQEREEKSPTWFWDKIADIPANEWGTKYDMLLLREGDSKVPMASGYKGYLETFFGPVKPDYIKKTYGGGKFKLVLEKNSRYETSHTFEIEGAPIYDLTRERPGSSPAAVATADTGFQQQFISVLREELQRSRESSQGVAPGSDKAMELVIEASKKAMTIMQEQAPQPGNSTQQLSELVNIVKGMMPAQSGGGILESLLVPLLKPLIEKLMTPANPLEQLTQLAGALELIDKIRGDGGGKRGDWKSELVAQAGQHLPDLVTALREGATANASAAADRRAAMESQERTATIVRSGAPPAPAASSPGTQGVIPSPAAPQPAVMPSSGLRTVPIDQSTAQSAPAQAVAALDTDSDAFVNFIKSRVVELIRNGSSGESIVDFLDGAKPEFSQQLVQYPVEIVTSFFRGDPILAQAAAHPRWDEVLREARAYILEEDGEREPVNTLKN